MSESKPTDSQALNTSSIDNEQPVRSPCVSNCCLDDQDICLGCFRHIDEIIGWYSADDERRRQIMDNVLARRN